MTLVDFNPYIVNSYYVIFVTVSVSMNGLIIYLVTQRSPQIVWNLKAMVTNTSIVQILIALLAGFLQGRILATTSGTAFLPVGPCRLFGPMTCFVTNNAMTALTTHVELLIVYTMFCRCRMLQSIEMRTENVLIGYVMMAISPIILLVWVNLERKVCSIICSNLNPLISGFLKCRQVFDGKYLRAACDELASGLRNSVKILPYTESLRFDVVMEQAIREHPDHNLEGYGEFGGSRPPTHPAQVAMAIIPLGIAVFSPIFMLYFKRRILKTLSSTQQRYTEKTVQSSKMFLKALTAQAMVPIICFVPVSVVFGLTTIFEPEIVFIEYLPHAFIVLPCILDPLTTMYFVSPYRTWILNKICKSL